MERKQSPQQMILRKQNISVQNTKQNPYLSPCIKIKYNWTKDHCKTGNSELLGEKVWKILQDDSCSGNDANS